jgi:putative redox protein
MASVTVESIGNYRMLNSSNGHAWIGDEPEGVGDGLGPDPYELLLSALGSCTAMTVTMYARRKGWRLENVRVDASHERIHAKDCEDCEEKEGQIDQFSLKIEFEGDLDEEQRKRLLEIAARCPVRRTLTSGPRVVDRDE